MKSSEDTLRTLLMRGKEGDSGAYHRFLSEVSGYLRAFFRKRLTRLPEEVEDLVQETLLAIHNHHHTYDPDQPLTAWMYAIARYKLVDMLRRHNVHDALNDPLDDELEVLAVSDAAEMEARRDVGKLLEQLPDRYRLPIQYVKLDGLTVAEAARLAGMSESGIKIGIHRGLKILAAKIRGDI